MAYEVRVKAKAKKAIRAIPQPKLRQRVRDTIDGLADEPRPDGSEKLEGTPKDVVLWRIRRGDFRVVYEIRAEELVVLVVLVAQREGVYKMLKGLK
ncbi:MAG: type II toxin-antitoxin system RelE family toxin [Rubrobacteraceae bacterium]|jgi:mRNA interferase RelE/StbE